MKYKMNAFNPTPVLFDCSWTIGLSDSYKEILKSGKKIISNDLSLIETYLPALYIELKEQLQGASFFELMYFYSKNNDELEDYTLLGPGLAMILHSRDEKKFPRGTIVELKLNERWSFSINSFLGCFLIFISKDYI